MSRKPIPKRKQKEIARERITTLFQEAEKVYSKNKSLSNRYVTLARKVAMKVRLRIPGELKRKFCKHCHKYLRSGDNCRVRTREGKLVIYCLECKKYTRVVLKKK